MSGNMKGAQAVMSSKENIPIYIHCFRHSLNLALTHASSTVPEISNVLKNVHSHANFFNESGKRTAIFLNYNTDDDPALAKNTTLKPQCPTRWTVRSKSLNIVNSQYETILSVLDGLISKEFVANGLSAFFEKTSSLFYLDVSVIVFGITELLARNLQTSDISITSALRQTEIVMGRLTDLRTEEKFTELWEKPVSLPCVRKPPKRLEHNINAPPPVQYSSPEQFLRQKYFAVIDSITGEIETRFQHPGVVIYKAIENVLVKLSNGEVENIRDQLLQNCEHFKGHLNVERFHKKRTATNLKIIFRSVYLFKAAVCLTSNIGDSSKNFLRSETFENMAGFNNDSTSKSHRCIGCTSGSGKRCFQFGYCQQIHSSKESRKLFYSHIH
ncbi:hypothetical protein PR048_027685, partial [Dryococelus australis]